jgi:hypothetical protein
MVGISETAYPRLKSHPTAKDLATIYTPSDDELLFAATQSQRPAPRTGFLILLKTFQRLWYFPQISDVPIEITTHIAQSVGLETWPADLKNYDKGNARVRHMERILTFLRVTPYGEKAKATLNLSSSLAAAAKDDLADIINIVIEELVRQRYELPGFTTLLIAANCGKASSRGCERWLSPTSPSGSRRQWASQNRCAPRARHAQRQKRLGYGETGAQAPNGGTHTRIY